MNYFVEGLQGSGKSTMVQKMISQYPQYLPVREGDYSPVELAWCAYVNEKEYQGILGKYSTIRSEIEAKSHSEEDHKIICYTQIITDIPGFHKDLEQYEIYNARVSYEEFKRIVLQRYAKWQGDNRVFECALFQNIVEDMILFRQASDQEILDFYKDIRETLAGKEYRIVYLQTEDIAASINVIRKERSDEQGNEMWFPMMCEYFNTSPYAKAKGLSGEKGLLEHFAHRQALELQICRELFPEQTTVLRSKKEQLPFF